MPSLLVCRLREEGVKFKVKCQADRVNRLSVVEAMVFAISILFVFPFPFDVYASSLVEHVRPDSYSVEVQSALSSDRARVVQVWAHVNSQGEKYRALMPGNTVRGPKADIQFKWSAGSVWAGSSERLELEWRWSDSQVWSKSLISEGFRSPGTGHLLSPALTLNWGQRSFGQVHLRFQILGTDGQLRLDAPDSPVLILNVAPEQPVARLEFTEQWQILQLGRLVAGQSFEIDYAISRIAAQIRELPNEDASLLRLFAHVQFDEDTALKYPLSAVHCEQPVKSINIMPTVEIPPRARLMRLWFSASYKNREYFDSNFGDNYWFVIRP